MSIGSTCIRCMYCKILSKRNGKTVYYCVFLSYLRGFTCSGRGGKYILREDLNHVCRTYYDENKFKSCEGCELHSYENYCNFIRCLKDGIKRARYKLERDNETQTIFDILEE